MMQGTTSKETPPRKRILEGGKGEENSHQSPEEAGIIPSELIRPLDKLLGNRQEGWEPKKLA